MSRMPSNWHPPFIRMKGAIAMTKPSLDACWMHRDETFTCASIGYGRFGAFRGPRRKHICQNHPSASQATPPHEASGRRAADMPFSVCCKHTHSESLQTKSSQDTSAQFFLPRTATENEHITAARARCTPVRSTRAPICPSRRVATAGGPHGACCRFGGIQRYA